MATARTPLPTPNIPLEAEGGFTGKDKWVVKPPASAPKKIKKLPEAEGNFNGPSTEPLGSGRNPRFK